MKTGGNKIEINKKIFFEKKKIISVVFTFL